MSNRVVTIGDVDEDDFWKMFSDAPDQPSEKIIFVCQIQPLLKKAKFKDERRMYRVFEDNPVSVTTLSDARLRATVTQKNLPRVARVMERVCRGAAIQYLGEKK